MTGTSFWQYKVDTDIHVDSLQRRRQTTLGGQKAIFQCFRCLPSVALEKKAKVILFIPSLAFH